MSAETQEWFIAERTKALALVALTRRDDLVVQSAGPGLGLAFIVSITREKGQQSPRQFGVVLRGSKRTLTEPRLDQALLPEIESFLRTGPFPYPVCLFYFTMDDSQGYWTWVAEPAVTEAGPRFLLRETPHGRKLDRTAVDEIVEQVDRWYDDFFGQITVRAS